MTSVTLPYTNWREIVISRFDGSLGLEGQPAGARQSEDAYGSTSTRPARKAAAKPAGSTSIGDAIDDDIPF